MFIIRQMQIKITVRIFDDGHSDWCEVEPHLTPVRMAIIKNSTIINAGEGVEKRESSYTVGGNVNWCSHYGEQYGGSLND